MQPRPFFCFFVQEIDGVFQEIQLRGEIPLKGVGGVPAAADRFPYFISFSSQKGNTAAPILQESSGLILVCILPRILAYLKARLRKEVRDMMVIPHTCINALAGRFIKQPASAFAMGIAGHAALDLVPHKDVSAHAAEGLMAGLMLGIIGTSCGFRSASFWCAVGGILPDVEQVLPWTNPKLGRRRYFLTHNRVLHSIPIPGKKEYRVGLLTQGAVSMAALLLAVARCRK
jgi:hypothetical protein